MLLPLSVIKQSSKSEASGAARSLGETTNPEAKMNANGEETNALKGLDKT